MNHILSSIAAIVAATGCSQAPTADADACADRCTFDLRAISDRVYGAGGDNLATNPNFSEDEDPKAPTSWRLLSTTFPTKDLSREAAAELGRKINSLVEMSVKGGMGSIRVPCEAVDLLGDRKHAASLQAYIGKRVMLENATGGVRRVSLQYRSNHEIGAKDHYAYVFAQPVAVKDASDPRPKEIGKWQCRDFHDTGEDSDYVNPWAMDVKVPEGANAIDFRVRFMGAGYLKFTGFSVATLKPDPPRPDVKFRLIGTYHYVDGRFEIESGKVGAVAICWNCSKKAAINPAKCWFEADVPAGFEFVGTNLGEDAKRGRMMERRRLEDGSERIRMPMGDRLRPYPEERFHAYVAPSLLVRSLKPAGFEATLKVRAIGPDGKPFDSEGACTLASAEPFTAVQPKRYRVGAMLVYSMENFRTGDGANEAYADYMREKGVTWLMPQTPNMVENPKLLPMWRAKGFDIITPTDHDYLMNAYNIHGTCPRPPEDGFIPRPGLPDRLRRAACPASIYEERPFFVTNIVPNLAARSAGTDGQWVNWEPYYFRGCQCDYCRKRGAEWMKRTGDGNIEHFYSWQHGELVKTVDRWMRKTFRPGKIGLMPAISWTEMCSQSRRNGYPQDKLSKDYAGDVAWMPAWGPYVGWTPDDIGPYGGPYALPRGSCVQYFVAVKDVREENDRAYPEGRRPKLMGQPAGPNWIIQPECLEIMCDSCFFNRWEAIAPWVFPYGADARHWRAYAKSVTRAAKFEAAVWDGKRADAATDIVARPGFEEFYTSLDKAYFADCGKVPLLQQTTYDHAGSRYVACFNFDDERHAEFTLRTRGLPPGSYRVLDEDGRALFGGRSFDAEALASKGVELALPASLCRVFTFARKD